MELLTGYRNRISIRGVDDVAPTASACLSDSGKPPGFNSHNGVHVATVSFPHGPEAWLSSQVPATQACQQLRSSFVGGGNVYSARVTDHDVPLEGHMTFLDPLHVEPDRGDGTERRQKIRRKVGRTKAQAVAFAAIEATEAYSIVNSPPLMQTIKMRSGLRRHGDTYREHSQQRRLAGVLQADHGDVHLRRPTLTRYQRKRRRRGRGGRERAGPNAGT